MLYPVQRLQNQATTAGIQVEDDTSLPFQLLEFHVRLAAALAIDLAFRPEYDVLFDLHALNKRHAWQIATQHFLLRYPNRHPELLRKNLLDHYCEVNGLTHQMAGIRTSLLQIWRENPYLFTGSMTMGNFNTLTNRLLSFLEQSAAASHVVQELRTQLCTEIAALREMLSVLQQLVIERNRVIHEFFPAATGNATPALKDNYFIKNAQILVIDGNTYPMHGLLLSDTIHPLTFSRDQLMRQAAADRLQTGGMNCFALDTCNKPVFLYIDRGLQPPPRLHLLSPLFASTLVRGYHEIAFYLPNHNNRYGDCTYMIMHVRCQASGITWTEINDSPEAAAANFSLRRSLQADATHFHVVNWAAPWMRISDARGGARPAGQLEHVSNGGFYRINLKPDEDNATYPDFRRCLRRNPAAHEQDFLQDQVYSPETLSKLTSMFTTDSSAPWQLAIWGKGGVGKTFTVLNELRKYLTDASYVSPDRRENFDFVFFLTAKTRLLAYGGDDPLTGSTAAPSYPRSYYSNTRTALIRLLCCLKDTLAVPDDQTADESQLIANIIGCIGSRKLLLILDDLDSVTGNPATAVANLQEQQALLRCIAHIRDCVSGNDGLLRVIITTRFNNGTLDAIELTQLNPDDAVRFAEGYNRSCTSNALTELQKQLIIRYAEGTPAFIIRMVFLFRSRTPESFRDQELERLQIDMATFSLSTTSLSRLSQSIVTILKTPASGSIRVGLIKLILFDAELVEIDQALGELQGWNMICQDLNGLISFRNAAYTLINVEATDARAAKLPPANNTVLTLLLDSLGDASYNVDTMERIVLATADRLLSEHGSLGIANAYTFARRLEWLIKPNQLGVPAINLSSAARTELITRINAFCASVAPALPAAAAPVEDTAATAFEQRVYELEVELESDTWTWEPDRLTALLTDALSMEPFPGSRLFRPAAGIVRDHIMKLMAYNPDESQLPSVERLVTLMQQCSTLCKDHGERGFDFIITSLTGA